MLSTWCSKHVEAWNKPILKQKFCASSWLITKINFPELFVNLRYLKFLSTKWRHSVCRNFAYFSVGSTVLLLLCRADWNRKCLRNVDKFLRLLEKQKPPKGHFDCYFFPHNIRISCLLCVAPVHPSPIVVGWILNSLDVIMIIESILLSPWRAALRSSSPNVLYSCHTDIWHKHQVLLSGVLCYSKRRWSVQTMLSSL